VRAVNPAAVLALVAALHRDAPRAGDVQAVSAAIAHVVAHDPLPPGWTPRYAAAALVVTAWDESRFRMGVVGDGGRARCAMQVWGPESLARDPVACVRWALAIMREGYRVCPEVPLAPYCGGCRGLRARDIARHRMWRAWRLAGEGPRG
jgi:hypothetical protein